MNYSTGTVRKFINDPGDLVKYVEAMSLTTRQLQGNKFAQTYFREYPEGSIRVQRFGKYENMEFVPISLQHNYRFDFKYNLINVLPDTYFVFILWWHSWGHTTVPALTKWDTAKQLVDILNTSIDTVTGKPITLVFAYSTQDGKIFSANVTDDDWKKYQFDRATILAYPNVYDNTTYTGPQVYTSPYTTLNKLTGEYNLSEITTFPDRLNMEEITVYPVVNL